MLDQDWLARRSYDGNETQLPSLCGRKYQMARWLLMICHLCRNSDGEAGDGRPADGCGD